MPPPPTRHKVPRIREARDHQDRRAVASAAPAHTGPAWIPRRTFCRWYDRYLDGGPEALADRTQAPSRVWNRIPADVAESFQQERQAPPPPPPRRDSRLARLVADAGTTRIGLETMGTLSTAQAAAWFDCCRSTLTDRIKLSYLVPGIVEAILAGRQPRTVTRSRLATIDLRIDWQQQRRMLGFV